MRNGTYVSADECERAEAFALGYQEVCLHPREVGVSGPGETLVFDFNVVLFDAHDLALRKASEAARRGVWVGFHTYYLEDPRLATVRTLPNVEVAKTHRELLALLCRRGNHGPLCPVERSIDEVSHVHDKIE